MKEACFGLPFGGLGVPRPACLPVALFLGPSGSHGCAHQSLGKLFPCGAQSEQRSDEKIQGHGWISMLHFGNPGLAGVHDHHADREEADRSSAASSIDVRERECGAEATNLPGPEESLV